MMNKNDQIFSYRKAHTPTIDYSNLQIIEKQIQPSAHFDLRNIQQKYNNLSTPQKNTNFIKLIQPQLYPLPNTYNNAHTVNPQHIHQQTLQKIDQRIPQQQQKLQSTVEKEGQQSLFIPFFESTYKKQVGSEQKNQMKLKIIQNSIIYDQQNIIEYLSNGIPLNHQMDIILQVNKQRQVHVIKEKGYKQFFRVKLDQKRSPLVINNKESIGHIDHIQSGYQVCLQTSLSKFVVATIKFTHDQLFYMINQFHQIFIQAVNLGQVNIENMNGKISVNNSIVYQKWRIQSCDSSASGNIFQIKNKDNNRILIISKIYKDQMFRVRVMGPCSIVQAVGCVIHLFL